MAMMDKSAADSYVYAKASGMLAHSYVGIRARELFSFNSLQELWSFLFKKEVPLHFGWTLCADYRHLYCSHCRHCL